MKNQLNLFWNTEKHVLHVKNSVFPVIRKMKNQLNLFWNTEKHVCTSQITGFTSYLNNEKPVKPVSEY